MDYEKTIPFTGNAEKAVELARNVFIQHGFQIVNNSDSALELVGTGTVWTKGQDPLVGISKVYILGTSSKLSIEAEFGAIRKTIKYLIYFLLSMAAFFLVVFGIQFYLQGQSVRKLLLITLAPFSPWPIIVPLMAKFMKFRTSRAIGVLLNNMAILGKDT